MRRFWIRWNHGRLWHGFAIYLRPDRNPIIAYGRGGNRRQIIIGRRSIGWGRGASR